MYANEGLQNSNLNWLQENAKSFDNISIFQVMDYLKGSGFQIMFETLNDMSSSLYSFDEIKIDEANLKAKIMINFVSHFGFSPAIQEVISERLLHTNNKSLLDFLNIFYNRIFEIYFKQIRLKYTFLSIQNQLKMISSLSGLFHTHSHNLLDYYLYFIAPYRSNEILKKMLSQVTKLKVEIDDFKPRYKFFSESYQLTLSRDSTLDGIKTIGKKYLSHNSAIEIIFYLQETKKPDFYKDKSKFKNLKFLIETYLNKEIEYKIKIRPFKKETSYLGNKINYLGINTFLCRNESLNKNHMFNFIHFEL